MIKMMSDEIVNINLWQYRKHFHHQSWWSLWSLHNIHSRVSTMIYTDKPSGRVTTHLDGVQRIGLKVLNHFWWSKQKVTTHSPHSLTHYYSNQRRQHTIRGDSWDPCAGCLNTQTHSKHADTRRKPKCQKSPHSPFPSFKQANQTHTHNTHTGGPQGTHSGPVWLKRALQWAKRQRKKAVWHELIMSLDHTGQSINKHINI